MTKKKGLFHLRAVQEAHIKKPRQKYPQPERLSVKVQ